MHTLKLTQVNFSAEASHIEASPASPALRERHIAPGDTSSSSQDDIHEVGATGRDTHARLPSSPPVSHHSFIPIPGMAGNSRHCRFHAFQGTDGGSGNGQCAETGESSCSQREREVSIDKNLPVKVRMIKCKQMKSNVPLGMSNAKSYSYMAKTIGYCDLYCKLAFHHLPF